MLKVFRESSLADKFILGLVILATIWSCHYGIVKGMESANQTYNTIISGRYY